jgi:hypothetical protein
MDDNERRKRGKLLLRRYAMQGMTASEAQYAVMHHPDLAGDPPSARAVHTWWRSLVLAPGDDMIDEDVRGALAHPIEDHRKLQLQAIAGRVQRHNTQISLLQAQLADAVDEENDEQATKLRAEIREEDKRVADAWKQHASITGIDNLPLEAHLGEAEARTRLVDALIANAREFELVELRGVIAAFINEVERRDSLAVELQRSSSRRELAVEAGLIE